MKKIFLVLAASFMLASCADSKVMKINGENVEVKPYGWMNKNSRKVEGVKYDVCTGSVVWSILLCESIVAPVLFTGLSLFEPVGYEGDDTCQNAQNQ